MMACPLQALQGVTLQVHRVSGTGRLCVDHLMGTQPGAEDTVIPLLIWKGHMRVLDPGDDTSAAELGHRWAREGKLARELVAVGWEELLDEGPDADPSVPGKPPACAHCKGAGNRAGRAAPRAPASFHEHPAQAQDALLKACARPLAYDPIFAYGIIGQEVYAGAGGWSSALRAEGFPVLEPIEYFEDPLHERGPRPEHDVRAGSRGPGAYPGGGASSAGARRRQRLVLGHPARPLYRPRADGAARGGAPRDPHVGAA